MKTSNKSRKLNAYSPIFENRIVSEFDSFDPLAGLEVFLSPQNAARYLDVSVKFIYERIQSGEIEAQALGGRIKRIKKGVLDKWLSAQAKKHGR